MRKRSATILALGILTGSLGLFFALHNPDSDQLLREAELSLKRRDYQTAEQQALQIPSSDPHYIDAMLIAGESATKLKRLEDAVRYYRSVAVDNSDKFVLVQFSLGNVLIHTGDLTSARECLQLVLESEPQDVATHSRMAFLYAAAARRWECRPHLELVLKSGSATVEELAMLADLERPVDETGFLERCQKTFPKDPNVRLGLASAAVQNGQVDQAVTELRSLVSEYPALMAAQALLGELLADDHSRAFGRWHASLSAEAEAWPDIWYARGLRAQFLGHSEMAARCFGEVLRISPIHRRASYQLGRVLTKLQHPLSDQFSEQARRLFDLTQRLYQAIRSEGRNDVVMHEIVKSLDEMGRVWETCAWAQLARQHLPDAEWPSEFLQRLAPLLMNDLPMLLPEYNLALQCDLSHYPSFRDIPDSESHRTNDSQKTSANTALSFREETAADLDFVYQNAADETTRGNRMQEQTGGGVAVIDADTDGWPDFYLVQGAAWPSGSGLPIPSDTLIDRIFRNRAGTTFEDVTVLTGIHEPGFGQSCAAGDLNEDGFDDLYVGNIGQNTLWLSNGDGTYTAAQSPESPPDHWTSSTAIADLNADGFADLIDINYVTGLDVFSRICSGRACSPSAFSGVPDQIHLSNGDGRFTTITASTPPAESKGLGLLIFRDPGDRMPSVFVANDQTPKFLLTLSRTEDGEWTLTDSAFRTGLAYNGDGLLTAAMGIAADDVDNNGLVDFFVTNFRDEANTLYLQLSPHLFQDLSRTAGLDAGGVHFVGWGTQFLDADRDGNPDLVIANGHVEDYRDEGGDYHMRPQLYQNAGSLHFQEVASTTAGEFFERKLLGRGLAKLDWNRDGLTDFAVSNIGAPMSLVTNTAHGAGHFLNVRLHATTTSRNAFFSRVEVRTALGSWSRQLCCGDGFHASNERELQFGLGTVGEIESLRVEWPSGAVTVIEHPEKDSTVELTEGRHRGILWKNRVPFPLEASSTTRPAPRAED